MNIAVSAGKDQILLAAPVSAQRLGSSESGGPKVRNHHPEARRPAAAALSDVRPSPSASITSTILDPTRTVEFHKSDDAARSTHTSAEPARHQARSGGDLTRSP
jgi:hypothetical protein